LRIGIFGACREGVDCLRVIKGGRISSDDFFVFLDNDERVIGRELDNCHIFHPSDLRDLKLDMLLIAVIDVHKIEKQVRNHGYFGVVKYFYGDQYFSEKERYIGMAKIGRYSYCKPSTFLYNVQIGNYCHIGADCRLGLIGHDPQNLTTYPLRLKSMQHEFKIEGATPKRFSPLIIEDDVYIGEGVSILSGIKIGRGAVVGSKSLVTSCVEPYTIVGGIPAKVLGSRLDIDTQKKLEESGWVDLDIDMAIKKLKEID
jgi:acetyltransferase-like isoleucine patch superfamily enzyme